MNIEPVDGGNGEEFILTDEHAWISVGNLSVRINDCGNFMKIGVWELGDEFNEPTDLIKVYQPAHLLNEDLELRHPLKLDDDDE